MHSPSQSRWPALLLLVWLAACEHKRDLAPQTLPARRDLATRASELPRAAPQAELSPKVGFLGDSISAGYGLPADEAFPAVLQRSLAQKGSLFQLANAGVSGDTTAGGLRRVDWVLKQAPAIVVIELGANDGLRGLAPAAIEANLREIVGKIRARGARPLLLGMRLPPSLGPEYTEDFAALYPRLAEQLGLPFVAHFMAGVAGEPELNQADGIHPTAEGQRRLAQNVAPRLEQLLRELSDASAPSPG